MPDYQTFLEKIMPQALAFKPNAHAHTSYQAFKENGEVSSKSVEGACYSIFRTLVCPALALHVGEERANYEGAKEWASWVINESMFKDAFLTKSVEEGLKSGFFINTSLPRTYVYSSMMVFRHAFEFQNWSWYKFRKLGYSGTESHALAVNFSVEDGNLKTWAGNHNHILIHPCRPYHYFTGGGRCKDMGAPMDKKSVGYQGLSESWQNGKIYCGDHTLLSKNIGMRSKKVKVDDGFGVIETEAFSCNKTNCNAALKYLKGLE